MPEKNGYVLKTVAFTDFYDLLLEELLLIYFVLRGWERNLENTDLSDINYDLNLLPT